MMMTFTIILPILGSLWRIWDGQGFTLLDRVYKYRIGGAILLSIIATLLVSGFYLWALPLAIIPVLSIVASPYKFMPTQSVKDWLMLVRFSIPALVYSIGLFFITGDILVWYTLINTLAGLVYITTHRLFEKDPTNPWKEKLSRYSGEVATGFSTFCII